MENKRYKRIPVLPATKKQFDVAKAGSESNTQDEFIKELLICRDLVILPRDLHYIKFPSVSLALREADGRVWITRGADNKRWVDITDIIPK